MFKTIKKVYCAEDLSWIKDCDISSVIVMKWLSMNEKMLGKLYYLDRFTYRLDNKHMLALISATIYPKFQKQPFCKYLKPVVEKEEFDFLLPRIQKYFKYSDREFNFIKPLILTELQKDLKKWFNFFGVDEKRYKEFNVELPKIEKIKEKKGLNMFFGEM